MTDRARSASGPKPPVDLSHYYSRVLKNRQPSKIKEFYKYFAIPGIGNLAGGLPNNNYFPFDTLEAKAAVPNRFVPTPNKPVDPPALSSLSISSKSAAVPSTSSSSDSESNSSRVLVPKVVEEPNVLRKIDLKSALQYGTAQGYPPLYQWLRQFTREHLHPNIPYEGGADIILTCGSTDGFNKAIDALSNPWIEGRDWVRDREGLMCEAFAYMNGIQNAKPRGLNIVPIAIDDEGMCAAGKGGLEDVLENWDYARGKRPHLIYTVTIGQNPTSGTLSVERRKAIYEICVKYDVVIIEDDPYWYLQYPSANKHLAANSTSTHKNPPPASYNTPKSSGFDFLDSLVPSYLSVDYQGRVVRLDTFSKTAAPGCRLGWITAQPALCEKLLRITETSTQQPSGFVQSMISEVLMGPQGENDAGRGGAKDGSGWQVSGWVRWLEGLRGNYERRMNTFCEALDAGKNFVKTGRRPSLSGEVEDEWSVVEKTQMYDFTWPLGGMFIWVRFDFATHPLAKKVEGAKLSQALWIKLTEKPFRVLCAPGQMFSPTQEIMEKEGWKNFRLCFAAVDEELVEPMAKRFAAGVKSFWGVKNEDDIHDLLESEYVKRDVNGDLLEGEMLGTAWGC
ncbi:hypothetical protein MMC25_008001 [Agyrium rufum]|nr:hypothetical protein [Agyrium rufum]